jgi:RHS repeat-associated protein
MTDGWVAMDDVSLTGATVTKYYYLGSQRVAMRQGGVLTYLHGDHLGSASLATNASGAKVSEMRYLPYGGTRSGEMPTDRQYTGQRWEASLGFYDYVARQYDPALGRFLQADTIIPDPANPQSLNRYSYTLGNPLRYIDVTGHYPKEVHYYLTRLWVYNAMVSEGTARGYDPMFVHRQASAVALQVAEANQAVDENPSDSSLFGHTLHWYSHAQAREAGRNAIAAADPEEFGRASHAIQDYYTHFGSGFTGYTGQEGVNDLRRRLATEDRYTLKGVELDGLPVQQLTLAGRLAQAGGIPSSGFWGHAVLYSDEYNPCDSRDTVMRREYEIYTRQFAARWWQKFMPARSQEDRRSSR